jgi:hypothetical protein
MAYWAQYSQGQRRMTIARYILVRQISDRSLTLAFRLWQKVLSEQWQQNMFVCYSIRRSLLCSMAWTLHLWRDYILGSIRWAVTVHNAIVRVRRRAASAAFLAWSKIFAVPAAQKICLRRLAGTTRRHRAEMLLRFHRAWAREAAVQLRRRCHAVAGLKRMLYRVACSALLEWRRYTAAEREAWIAVRVDMAAAAAFCIDAAIAGIREGIYQVVSSCLVGFGLPL